MKFLWLLLLLLSCASQKKEVTPEQKKAQLHYNQGTKELVAKDYTSALTHLIEANALNPDDSKTLNNLGMAYFFKKSIDRSIRYLKRSIELDPKNTDARLNLATVYMKVNKLNEAEHQYLTILEDLTYQKQQRTHYNLGLLYIKKRQLGDALAQFQKSLEIDETYCPANFQLGLISYRKKSYDQAYEYFKDASFGKCYKLVEPQYHQALTLVKMGNLSLAKLKFEEIVDRFPRTDESKQALKFIDQFPKLLSSQINGKVKKDLHTEAPITPDF